MKINILFIKLLCLLFCIQMHAQDSLVIYSGATLQMDGGNIYIQNGRFINNGTFAGNAGTVHFTEAAATSNTSIAGTTPTTFYNLTLNKTSNDAFLEQDITIVNQLDMTSGKLDVQDHNLNISDAASIVNASATSYLETSSTGSLVQRVASSQVDFPVGKGSYTPISITNSGTADTLSVRVDDTVYSEGTSGTEITEDIVDRSWYITENTEGGSNLTLTAQWNTSDELTNFDRTSAGIHQYSTYWETNAYSTSFGGDPYFIARGGITSTGVFSIGGSTLAGGVVVDMMAFLEGPYNGAAGMNDYLRSANLIPTSEPYTDLGFTHVFRGGGETIDASVLTVTGTAAVIDWVFVELRSPADPSTIVATKSALILADGRITDLDGTSNLTFEGVVSDAYYISLKHRNHLGIMGPNILYLSRTPTTIDFTTLAAYQPSTQAPQKTLSDGYFGLITGDVDGSGAINAADRSITWNQRNTTGYLQADASMDTNVNAADRSITWNKRNTSAVLP